MFFYNEAVFYWPWWICFIAIAFFLARYVGWIGLIATIPIVSGLILAIEMRSVFHDMNQFPDSGRDVDGPFLILLLFRMIFYNVCLLPVGIFGVVLRKRRKHVT